MVHNHPVKGPRDEIREMICIGKHRDDIVGTVQVEIPDHEADSARIDVNTKNIPRFSRKYNGKRTYTSEHVDNMLPLILKPDNSLPLGGKTW